MSDTNGPSGSSSCTSAPWPSASAPDTSAGVTANRAQISTSSYQIPGYDNNNNSSSCTNHERFSAQSADAKDIAELAKTIGNEFRGEFIVLPHHLVNFDNGDAVDLSTANAEDDVSSNSEDCVYAYRPPIPVDDQEERFGALPGEDDDETDFLEMDFDPNSEQESNNPVGISFRRSGSELNGVDITQADRSSLFDQPRVVNEWRECNEPMPGCSRAPVDVAVDDADEEDNAEDDLVEDIVDGGLNDELDSETESIAYFDVPVQEELPKVTGTKPKVKQPPTPSTTTNEDKDNIINISNISYVPVIPCNTNADVGEGFSCLECSEMELPTTSSSTSSVHSPSTAGVCRRHCKKLKNNETEQAPPAIIEDSNQIQICPNILDEQTVFSSFQRLGIDLDRSRLHQEMQVHRMALEERKTIAGYLINFSKANCDPRRFVKIIEQCCPQQIFGELEFNFQSVAPEFNVLQVPAAEILKRWSSDDEVDGLRELSQVNNKRFQSANVLGKVANLLRFARGDKQKCREGDKVVLVPTYSRPGVLLISRQRPEDNQTTTSKMDKDLL